MIVAYAALLAPSIPAYVIHLRAYAAVCAGSSLALRTAVVKAVEPGNLRLAGEVWEATTVKPSGSPTWNPADVLAVWNANPGVRFDPLRQTGYRRETDLGYTRFGSPSGEAGVIYVVKREACPCDSLDDAKALVASAYVNNRAWTWDERGALDLALLTPGSTGGDLTAGLAGGRWGAYQALYKGLPDLYSSTLPKELAFAPYDSADIMPASIAPSVPYQSRP